MLTNLRYVVATSRHEILRRVKPEPVPQGWQDEVSVKPDALQIAFRKRIDALEAAGWATDEDRIARDYTGKRAVAIPCPARRMTDMSWPIPEIPML